MFAVKTVDAIARVDADVWNAVTGIDYPFTRHEYLLALEESGAVCEKTGWEPRHMLVYQNAELVAVLPSYLKHHSYGEYVFDFSWADAYHRSGLEYYPKWLSAIPYTPVTGPRLAVKAGSDVSVIWRLLLDEVKRQSAGANISSWHLLFPDPDVSSSLPDDLLQRTAVHFQWKNRGYHSFDDFLAAFSSRKRKNLRKERQAVLAQGITMERLPGAQIDGALWERFYHFYQMTYAKRSGHGGYLNQQFFELISHSMPENLLLVLARRDGQAIAGALNFCDSQTLYGRYWGCIRELEFLHFETCYYQGIEHCIEQKFTRFDPGVQGEHKIQRGFEPTFTYSNHWLAHPQLHRAVADFLRSEKLGVREYFHDAQTLLPFKQS